MRLARPLCSAIAALMLSFAAAPADATICAAITHDDASNLLSWTIPFTVGATADTLISSANISDAIEMELLGGLWYINLHSNAFPGGEIRGQWFRNLEPPH